MLALVGLKYPRMAVPRPPVADKGIIAPKPGFSVIQCHSVSFSVIQCHSVSFSVIQCHSVSFSVIQCHSVSFSVIQCHYIIQNVGCKRPQVERFHFVNKYIVSSFLCVQRLFKLSRGNRICGGSKKVISSQLKSGGNAVIQQVRLHR